MTELDRSFPQGPPVLLETEEWIANFKMTFEKIHLLKFYDSYLDAGYISYLYIFNCYPWRPLSATYFIKQDHISIYDHRCGD